MAYTIKGVQQVSRNLNREIKRITGRTAEGILAAALFVKGEAQEITPQRKGVLVNSAFTRGGTINGNPVATVGYTAKYAAAVHEMPDTYNYTKPGTGPKFLQKAVWGNTGKIVSIISAKHSYRHIYNQP